MVTDEASSAAVQKILPRPLPTRNVGCSQASTSNASGIARQSFRIISSSVNGGFDYGPLQEPSRSWRTREREPDPPRGLLRRRVRDCDHAARARHPRAGSELYRRSRPRARDAVAELRRLRGLVPHDRNHLDQPPRDDPQAEGGRPRNPDPEPPAPALRGPAPVHDRADGRISEGGTGGSPRRGDLRGLLPADVDRIRFAQPAHPVSQGSLDG